MPKSVICVQSTLVENNEVLLNYSVSVIGPPNYSYSSTYIVNTTLSVNSNLIAWRNKIIAQAAEKGVVLSSSDVIVFGAPS